MQLSKSDYMLFLKHPSLLWLKKYEKEKILDDLLKYCGLDTLATVEIYNVLRIL